MTEVKRAGWRRDAVWSEYGEVPSVLLGAQGLGDKLVCYPLNEWWVSSCFALKILFALAIWSSILSNCICPYTDSNTISVNWLSPVSLKKSQTHLWPHIKNSIFCMLPIDCAYLMISSFIFLSPILWLIYTYIYIYISHLYIYHLTMLYINLSIHTTYTWLWVIFIFFSTYSCTLKFSTMNRYSFYNQWNMPLKNKW